MKDRIFSGDRSRDMWDAINGAKSKRQFRRALYILGCRCQELEAIVRRQQKQIDKLKDDTR